MKPFTNRKKRMISIALCIVLSLSVLSGCGKKGSYQEFLDQLFIDEVSSNTINLRFTLENPKEYGIENYQISFGDISKKARNKQIDSLEKTKRELSKHSYITLDTEEKLTYEILKDYLDTSIKLSQYDLFTEMLSPNNGLQTQLPVLMTEYKFNTKQDVKDYLKLLSITDEYYVQIMDFEKEKAAAGLFMSDSACEGVIAACESFLNTKEDSFMSSTFVKRLQKLDGLSQKEIDAFVEENNTILKEQFFPAYEYLIHELTHLLGSGTNDLGLCYYDNGIEYYEILLYSQTGCNDSAEKIFAAIDNQRNQDLIVCSSLQEKDENLLEKCSSLEWHIEEPKEMLTLLQSKIENDFPKPPENTYEISYVDEALEEFLAPAFYITAPIDNYNRNSIYINNAYLYPDIYYFTTLAHEGYPGHLYQTVCSYEYGLSPVRSILDYSGYTEGWATYVEYLSYNYANVDTNIAEFLSHNQSATLSLYASSDIGLHYYGWTMNEMYDFWRSYGIEDQKIVKEIAEYILAEPCNYLSYYVGYLEILELKNYTENLYKEDFSLKEFHRTLLEIGPAPFHIIEKYISEYYTKKSS